MTALITERRLKTELRAKPVSVKSYWLTTREFRLDASFYAENSQRAIRLLKESGYEITNIGTLSKQVFNPPPIKRQYSGTGGTPYLMPTELFSLRLKPTKFVFAHKMENIQEWFVKDGWIILTQSGKTGVPLYVTESLENFVISQNAIRIVPRNDVYSGFLYAYLSTWLGQALVTKDQFGVTVEHIRPHHVKSVVIPSLHESIQKQIHENMARGYALRDKARDLLSEAEQLLFQELGITKKLEIQDVRAFSIKSSELDLRLDASYHLPFIKFLHLQLCKSKYPLEKVKDNLGKVSIPPRFKRIFVEKDYGIPYLLPTHIVQIRPFEQKYISKKATMHLDEYILRKGWVLVTTDGTIGRTAVVPCALDGWFGSNNIARIIPNKNKVDAGYLAIFLMSKLGQFQILRGIYGGVVDHIEKEHIEQVQVPIPPLDIQEKIGKIVVEAFELKQKANDLETSTVELLEALLQEGKKVNLESYLSTFETVGNMELNVIQGLKEEKQGELGSWEQLKKETGINEI